MDWFRAQGQGGALMRGAKITGRTMTGLTIMSLKTKKARRGAGLFQTQGSDHEALSTPLTNQSITAKSPKAMTSPSFTFRLPS